MQFFFFKWGCDWKLNLIAVEGNLSVTQRNIELINQLFITKMNQWELFSVLIKEIIYIYIYIYIYR